MIDAVGARPAVLPGWSSAPPGARARFHVVVVMAGVGLGLTGPFTALLVVVLGGPPDWAAYVVSSMGLSLLLVDFLGTRFVPRLSSRTALTVSMVVFGFGSLLSAVSTSWQVVGMARVLQGFGAALFMGGGVVLAVRLVGEQFRGRAIGTFNAAWFVGVAAGPLGGGLIAATSPGAGGLRLLFAVCAGINFLGAATAWFLVPRWDSRLPPRLGLPAGLGVRGRRVWSVLILAGLGQVVRGGLALTLIPLLGKQLGMGWVALGAALCAMTITDVGAMHLVGTWTDRRGRMLPLVAALAWGAVVLTALAAVARGPVTFTLGALAVGVTIGTTWVVPTAMTVDLATEPDSALAVYRIGSDIGLLAGGLITGTTLALGGVRAALAVMAVVLVAGLILTITVGETLPAGRRRPRSSPDLAPVVISPAAVSLATATSAVLSQPPLTDVKEELVSLPSLEEFAVFAANSDITFTPERLCQAYAWHNKYRADLERLRRLPLPFTEPVTEPATALAWIARGDQS